MLDKAEGIASTPAPTMVLTRLMTLLVQEAWPWRPFSLRRGRRDMLAVLLGRDDESLGGERIEA